MTVTLSAGTKRTGATVSSAFPGYEVAQGETYEWLLDDSSDALVVSLTPDGVRDDSILSAAIDSLDDDSDAAILDGDNLTLDASYLTTVSRKRTATLVPR